MNIVDNVKNLNLPLGQYVIISSGILDALGIRSANDIDITVLPYLHRKLRESGEYKEDERYGKIFLIKEGVEINPDVSWSDYKTSTEELIKSATIINGIPFMNLDELRKFKTALGREKDLKDIELIDKYLETLKP